MPLKFTYINGEYPVDTMASFSCSSGFSLSGSESTVCQMSGHWGQQSPMCNEGKEGNFYNKITRKVPSTRSPHADQVYVNLKLSS